MDKATVCECGKGIDQLPGRGRHRKKCTDCSPRKHVKYTPVERDQTCTVCGKSFPGTKQATYCSNACKWLVQERKPCSVCGGPTGWRSSALVERPTCNDCRRDYDRFEHGTRRGYYGAKCRCEDCRLWNRKVNQEYREKRRAEGRPLRSFGSSGPWINPKVRVAVYERDNWTCQACGVPTPLKGDPNGNNYPSLDHIVPQSKGGSHDITNLRLLCRWCNCVRGNGDYHQDLFGEAS